VRATIVAPLLGLVLESERVELGDGLALVRGEAIDAPPEAVWPEEGEDGGAVTLCVFERDVSPDDPLPAVEARERSRQLITGLRLFKAGGVTLGAAGWRRAAEGRWAPVALEGAGSARGAPWVLAAAEEEELREFLAAIGDSTHGANVAWALSRFEMGCSQVMEADALSDYLLALRALLDASSDAGRASLALRLAALCAEEGERRAAQRRVELALSLERFVMGGGHGQELQEWIGPESPRAIVEQLERHLHALLRDVLCGYLDSDLKGMADDILLETRQTQAPDPFEIEVRDLRREPPPPATVSARRSEADTSEFEAVEETQAGEPEGVTPSADWGGLDEDPESYSAPV
jgi:hypothetical protein